MMETIAEYLKWPVVFLICYFGSLFIFRMAFTGLVARAKRAVVGDKVIEFETQPEAIAEQQKKLEAPATANRDTVPASHAMPPASPVYAPIEQQISDEFAKLKLPTDLERAWLTRGIAIFRVARAHEAIYRLILGSQITLLLQANSAPPDMVRARAIYDAAKEAFPDFYTNFDFDNWVGFPVNMGFLRLEDFGIERPAVLKITPLGQDFLHYLVSNSLTTPKPG
jgi:hypothetical protein